MTYEPIEGTLVIGLTGHARHGKDLAASIIANHVPGAMAFAISDLIAAHARAIGAMGKRDPSVLQKIGYAARQRNPRVWLDALYYAIQDRRPPLALVAGVRFPDEAELVRSAGGYVIRIDRWNADGTPFMSGDRDASYPTETAINGVAPDYKIDNVTGLQDRFRDDVMNTYQAILQRHEEVVA